MDAERSTLGISLAELLPKRQFFGTTDLRVSSCCTNPTMCRPGDLYVATVDTDQDGHDGAVEAVRRGASGVLGERLLPGNAPQCVVPNSRSALAMICQGLAGFPGQRLPVLGIGGLRGLTPCEVLLRRVLEQAGETPAGFNSQCYSTGLSPIARPTPRSSAALHAQWLANGLANGCTHAVSELPRWETTNHIYDATPLAALLITELRSIGSATTPTPAAEAYFRRLVQRLESDALLVANVDCPVVRHLLADLERPVLTVSTCGEPAELTATMMESCPSEQTFLLRAGYDSVPVRTKTIGTSHTQACVLAAAAALSQGIDLTTIVKALESVEFVPGHLERIECGQPFSVYVDNSPTSADLHYALRSLRNVTQGNLICLFGPGLGAAKTRWRRGRTVERNADLAVITSDDPRDNGSLRPVHDVLDGVQQPAKAHIMPNRFYAIEWALAQCKPGDTLLLAGPHNRSQARSDDDFPRDGDAARYWLLESSLDLEAEWTLPRR